MAHLEAPLRRGCTAPPEAPGWHPNPNPNPNSGVEQARREPCVSQPATLCTPACNPMYPRRRGADPDRSVDAGGYTPLMLASRHGHANIVRRLLRAGAKLGVRLSDGATPARLAQEHGHPNPNPDPNPNY